MKRIYVGNLSYRTTEEGLESAFAAFGTVNSVAVIRDPATGQSRGFGFVEMADDAQAEAAIQGLNGTQVDGRAVTVNEARRARPAAVAAAAAAAAAGAMAAVAAATAEDAGAGAPDLRRTPADLERCQHGASRERRAARRAAVRGSDRRFGYQ